MTLFFSIFRKVLERPLLEIVLQFSTISVSTIFSELNPKGGPFYAKVKKSKKSNFFCSKSYFFYLNMNYKCSKLSIEVSDMSYNQFLVILRAFLQGGKILPPPHVVTSFPEPMQNRVKHIYSHKCVVFTSKFFKSFSCLKSTIKISDKKFIRRQTVKKLLQHQKTLSKIFVTKKRLTYSKEDVKIKNPYLSTCFLLRWCVKFSKKIPLRIS